MGSNFVDEIDCGSFFDQIDDLIEFPPDNDCGDGNLISSGDCEDFTNMWNDALPDGDPFFSGTHVDSASDLSAELSVPYEDIVQLEWLSTFVEDSFSGGGLTIGKENLSVDMESSRNPFRTSSPVSVLESSSSSSSSCSGGKTIPLSPSHRGPQRARSKRPRPPTFNPRAAIQLISPSSSSIETETPQPVFAPGFSSESDNFADSPPKKKVQKLAETEQKKHKKIKITLPADPTATLNEPPAQAPVRKCLHCEITKTPQWRAGPMGPKTLCNACGVRYKSGRLYPEYRPAASPTFVPSLHSNSHKKVIEMRSKVGPITQAAEPEIIPNAS
ncbi:GATA transcription factor 8 [Sesamum alatum]|uniref:GATA transcription factor n=1 Tax=Sesamum alatum TaxID=300844 RepID=A0AAE1YJ14_9LAMI|nr:GATA transcription factor 8 [Sesamum alatum]